MKTTMIISLIAISIGATGLTSCNKKLDLVPVSTISDESYWKTPDQFDAFVTGLHARFRDHAQSFMYLGELRGDIFGNDAGTSASFTGEASQGLERMWLQNLDLDNPGVSNYGDFYSNINQLNLLISKLNTTSVVTEATKQYYLGIAHGMRAFYYFQLYRSWGNAILQTEAIADIDVANLAKEAAPANEVLAFVKQDIEASITNFGSDYSIRSNKAFWSKPASLMLKAEVFLWTAHREGGAADAEVAKQALLEVQSNLSLNLLTSYANVFDAANKGNAEMIFVIRHQLNEATLGFIGNFVPQTGLIANFYDSLENRQFSVTADNYGGLLRGPTKIQAYRKFKEDDTRKNTSIQAAYEKDNVGKYRIAGCFLRKFQGEQNAGMRAYTNDYPIYRYADLLLLLAEAKEILGENPADEINQVRQRAYGGNYQATVHGYPNQLVDANPAEAILQERFFEFVGEGKRWYDLRRFGDAFVYKYTGLPASEAYKLYWPIDRNTLTNNRSLTQTDGYSQF